MEKQAVFKLSYGLYVISSSYDGEDSACIANTLAQVTSEPMQLSVTVNKNNFTTSLIMQSKLFNGAVLLDKVDMDTIARFGFQSGKDVDKFDGIDYTVDSKGLKQIKDNIAATFTCKVVKSLDVGTHMIFIGEVVDAKVVSDEPVLTYENYHTKKKGTTPKNAATYVEETKVKGYRCGVCGYVLEADELPEDFVCPICKQPASVFEKVE